MKKVAILISGEYRTFDLCRPTMTFLDEPNVDIYFSTWDRTICKNEILGLDINEQITLQRISKTLRKNSNIKIEKHNLLKEKKYNSKMLHRWKVGFEMILKSNIKYDYVMIVRPDLYFNNDNYMFKIDDLIKTNTTQFGWFQKDKNLQDNIFFLNFDNAKKLFDNISIKNWEETHKQDWHTYWTELVYSTIGTEIKRLGKHVRFTFCRLNAKENDNFEDIVKCYEDWKDIEIYKQVKLGNIKQVTQSWGEETVKTAIEKYNNNTFFRYRNVAVYVHGMMRTFNLASKSWEKLFEINADWYLSTWDKTQDAYKNNLEYIEKFDTSIFRNVNIEEYDNFKTTSTLMRGGSNSIRHLHLLTKFSNEMQRYEKIIIIRPDTFLQINDIEKFKNIILKKNDNNAYSNIVRDDFIQDFCYVVPNNYFTYINALKEKILTQNVMNPHIELFNYFKNINTNCTETDIYDSILVRNNCTIEDINKGIKQIAKKFNEYKEKEGS